MQTTKRTGSSPKHSKAPWLLALVAAGALMLPAAAQARPVVVIRHVVPKRVVVVKPAPRPVFKVVAPAPKLVKVVAPKPHKVWVKGHWKINRFGRRVWVRGHWALR